MSLTIQNLIINAHKTSKSKGWWDNPERNIGELLALVHSEISEALEVYRDLGVDRLKSTWRKSDGKPEGFTVELADAIIRIADLCGAFDLELEEAIQNKMKYNRSRPHRHGGKLA